MWYHLVFCTNNNPLFLSSHFQIVICNDLLVSFSFFFFFLDFSVILIFLLASEEGLFSDRNIGQFVKVYIFFGLFFCLLLRSAVRISLPFYISLTLNLTLKQHSFFKKIKGRPRTDPAFYWHPFLNQKFKNIFFCFLFPISDHPLWSRMIVRKPLLECPISWAFVSF